MPKSISIVWNHPKRDKAATMLGSIQQINDSDALELRGILGEVSAVQAMVIPAQRPLPTSPREETRKRNGGCVANPLKETPFTLISAPPLENTGNRSA